MKILSLCAFFYLYCPKDVSYREYVENVPAVCLHLCCCRHKNQESNCHKHSPHRSTVDVSVLIVCVFVILWWFISIDYILTMSFPPLLLCFVILLLLFLLFLLLLRDHLCGTKYPRLSWFLSALFCLFPLYGNFYSLVVMLRLVLLSWLIVVDWLCCCHGCVDSLCCVRNHFFMNDSPFLLCLQWLSLGIMI